MRMTPRTTVGLALAGALLVAAVTGCGGSSSPGEAASASTTSGGTGTSAASVTTVSVPGVKVDLVITGAKNATIKGTKGRCTVSTSPGVGSSVDLTGADYPSLGSTGAFDVEGPHTNTFVGGGTHADPGLVKFDIDGTGGITGDTPNITMSADQKTFTLDTDVDASTGGVTTHENIKGTIVCS